MMKWCKNSWKELQFCTLICGSIFADDLKESELPLIYFMDCTLNECSSILRSATQVQYLESTPIFSTYIVPFSPLYFPLISLFFASCSWYMQRELYPSLLLFPAGSKNAVPYEGDIAVSDIIKFIIDQGNNPSTNLKEKGVFFLNYWFPWVAWILCSFSFSNWLYCVFLRGMVY